MRDFMKKRSEPQPQSGSEWDDFEINLQRYGLLGLAGTGLVASLVIGPQVLITLTVLGGIGMYLVDPNKMEEWFNAHSGMLIGGLAGFVYMSATIPLIGGPLGLITGAWIGKKAQDLYNSFKKTTNQVAEAVEPIIHPVKTVQNGLKKLWGNVKRECHELFYAEATIDDLTIEEKELDIEKTEPKIPRIELAPTADDGVENPVRDLIVYQGPPILAPLYQIQHPQQTPAKNEQAVAASRSWWQRMGDNLAQGYQAASKGPRTII